MNKEDIFNYISSNLKRGLSNEEIKQGLLFYGVSDFDIESAFSEIDSNKSVKYKSLSDFN